MEGLLAASDMLTLQDAIVEPLIWAPPRGGLKSLFSIFARYGEAARALDEVQFIPLVCSKCTWEGYRPHIFVRPRPKDWMVRCPKCSQIVVPDIDYLNLDLILKQWEVKGKPRLDPPAAAASLRSARPILNLEEWLERFNPMENELAYVGQQLWSNLAHFFEATKKVKKKHTKRQSRKPS